MKWWFNLKQIGGQRQYGITEIDLQECQVAPNEASVDQVIEMMRPTLRLGVGRMLGYHYFMDFIQDGSVGAEIGVDCGDGLARLLECTKCAHVDAVDPWITTDDGDLWTDVGQALMDKRHKYCVDEYGGDRVTIHRCLSQEYWADVKPNSLDWAYIDGDHTTAGVSIDIQGAYRSVRPGGIIGFDDCMCDKWKKQIRRVIDPFMELHKDCEFINNLYDPWIIRKCEPSVTTPTEKNG